MKKTKVVKTPSSALSQRALLVQVTISQWTARKKDAVATETVITTHNTDASAGAYTKKLLPGAAELETVSACATKIRKYFHEQTLPWMSDGSRIISAKNHLKFTAEFRKMKSEYDSAVRNFVAAYPSLQAKAQTTLGNLYRSEEYPDATEIDAKFQCEANYLPIPDLGDFRVEISDSEKRNFVKKMQDTEQAATRDVWNRLHGVVKSAAEKLSKSDAIFRDSLIGNLREMTELLPVLNISEDPKLDAAKKELGKILDKMGSADSIRADESKRKDAAKALKSVQDKMGAFMGGSSK